MGKCLLLLRYQVFLGAVGLRITKLTVWGEAEKVSWRTRHKMKIRFFRNATNNMYHITVTRTMHFLIGRFHVCLCTAAKDEGIVIPGSFILFLVLLIISYYHYLFFFWYLKSLFFSADKEDNKTLYTIYLHPLNVCV